jgi:hypothetical protein
MANMGDESPALKTIVIVGITGTQVGYYNDQQI